MFSRLFPHFRSRLYHFPTQEAIHIQREQPYLNQQLHHVNLSYPYNYHIVTFHVHFVVTVYHN